MNRGDNSKWGRSGPSLEIPKRPETIGRNPSLCTGRTTVGFLASDLCPQTDYGLLGDNDCLTGGIFWSASLGGWAAEHLPLHCLVSSVASWPCGTSTDPATAKNAHQCPPPLSRPSSSVLDPEASSFPHSPHRGPDLRDCRLSCPPLQAGESGHRLPQGQNEGSLLRTKAEDPLSSGRGQLFGAATHRRQRGDSERSSPSRAQSQTGGTRMGLEPNPETVKTST